MLTVDWDSGEVEVGDISVTWDEHDDEDIYGFNVSNTIMHDDDSVISVKKSFFPYLLEAVIRFSEGEEVLVVDLQS